MTFESAVPLHLQLTPNLKIAIIAHDRFPLVEPHAGGLERFTADLAHQLVLSGYSTTLYCPAGSVSSAEVRIFDESEPKDFNATTEKLAKFFIDDGEQRLCAYRYINCFNELKGGEFDIILNQSLHYWPLLVECELNQLMLTTFHTPPFEHLTKALELSERSVWNSFVTVSHCMAEAWSHYVPNIKVIYNSVDLGSWDYGKRPESNQLCWVGRICSEKGTFDAIKAVEGTTYTLKIAGPIFDQIYFDEEIAPLLELPNVEYVGHLNQQELSDLFKSSHAFLFTSIWDEPYGLVIAESLASGTPVAAYDSGAASEIINPRCGQLVEAGNIIALRKSIPDAIEKSRWDCRRRAEVFCDPNNMLEIYMMIINRQVAEFGQRNGLVIPELKSFF